MRGRVQRAVAGLAPIRLAATRKDAWRAYFYVIERGAPSPLKGAASKSSDNDAGKQWHSSAALPC